MDRLAYLIRRLLLVIPTFIGITIICFSLTRFLPGGPVELKLMKMRGMGGGGTRPVRSGKIRFYLRIYLR